MWKFSILIPIIYLLSRVLSGCHSTFSVDTDFMMLGVAGNFISRLAEGAAGGVATGAANILSARHSGARNRQHAHDMLTRQQAWYHPKAIMQRLEEAGVNPKMAFAEGYKTQGGTATGGEERPARLQRIEEAQNIRMRNQQIENLAADNRIKQELVDDIRQRARANHWRGGLYSRQMAQAENELNFFERHGFFKNQNSINLLMTVARNVGLDVGNMPHARPRDFVRLLMQNMPHGLPVPEMPRWAENALGRIFDPR